MQRIRLGYAGPQKKWESIKWNEFITYAGERGMDVIYIDLDKDLEPQGPFDIILHKVTYMMHSPIVDQNPLIKNLITYIRNHPEVIVLDNLEAVGITLDRELLNNAIESIKWPEGVDIRVPHADMLLQSDLESIKKVTSKLRFPLLSKPKVGSEIVGATKETAHMLRLATSPESLVGVATPTLLQEYINHGGVVYKIYTIGDHLEVTARPSTRNVESGEDISIDFHSERPDDPNGVWIHKDGLDKIQMPIEDFKKLSKAIRTSMKMELIGFDILIDEKGAYWIVDLNFFPGYKMIPNLWELFYNFFMSLLKK
ncbi:Inositol 1, 3, 4-trisphosphate 5/6-kinase family protein [Trichomonas vaginalis G3]|uniref:Inositol-tetrakisphosphate 1-kinase n=1 Tax=Trichomonas vaginalis (strain ATCC PRA-98 / G3) TaxID=412133 RepID=A2E245_TRIV3|nr:inositol tetrakisphosphate 1-kinase protein [Trichomonas vaginalis G3]EAY13259.1 Inositol 1, 3, 4-trisphosphate 5/6-kinase family protein [Trichomonas vaginalis G3]KAI5494082.1 inositol tetrakisphosphate 1-kinase protein [Trichomonas vaginalis G3]|eukprot:XP_001325482.1 Inositol 1, 3, 4-trisphosphate 5/6-kinase family protein [Trichomonas vaginalis G3]